MHQATAPATITRLRSEAEELERQVSVLAAEARVEFVNVDRVTRGRGLSDDEAQAHREQVGIAPLHDVLLAMQDAIRRATDCC